MTDDRRDRREQRHAPPHVRAQTAAPVVEVDDETSEAHAIGPMRDAYRASHPSDDRIGRLEHKHDGLVGVVTDIRVTVGRIEGKLEGMVELMQRESDLRAKEAAASEQRLVAIATAEDRQHTRNTKVRLAMVAVLVPLVTALGIAQVFR